MKHCVQHVPRSLELLAPAGGPESGYAALHYGADAVYLGLAKFSARADAENFTLEQLSEITAYAHSLAPRRRIYVALNTLMLQHELDELVDCLGAISEIGVDALIVQDLGVGYIARRHFPALRLHASTQLAIHSRYGVEAARDMGFARVTLARELTLEEIAQCAAVPGIETESFVHGALCYAYSGLCLFSSQILGRSGNRGRCAYLCRDRFTLAGSAPALAGVQPPAGFLFSMKDLALADVIPALRRSGVTALKIEGRKKSPLYVAATVVFYRKLLDGALADVEARELAADIQTIFSRPWTSLFALSRANRQVIDMGWVGHRGTPIGKVDAVIRSRSGEGRLRFRSAREIELHDGLQVDVPGLARPYGFAVNWFRIVSLPNNIPSKSGRAGDQYRYCAPAGSVLEVALPADHPDLPQGAMIYCASAQAIKRRYRFKRPKPGLFRVRPLVVFNIKLSPKLLLVTASLPDQLPLAVETSLSVTGDFQVAVDPDRMDKTFKEVFAKLGASQFAAGALTISNPQSRFVPMSRLNPLRRQLLEDLEGQWNAALRQRLQPIKEEFSVPDPKIVLRYTDRMPAERMRQPSDFRWSLKTDAPAALDLLEAEDWSGIDELILEIGAESLDNLPERLRRLADRVGREHLRLALPPISRAWEHGDLGEDIRSLIQAGWIKWQIANISGWAWLKSVLISARQAINIAADWPIYATNRAAARQILALGADYLTLSPEDGLENMRSLLAEWGVFTVVVAYQDTPLFISEACAGASCACDGRKDVCVESMDLKSSFGDHVLAFNRRCRTVLINSRPFCLAPRFKDLNQAGAVRLRADFLFRPYTPEQVREIWRNLRAGRIIPGTHLGNIDRGLA